MTRHDVLNPEREEDLPAELPDDEPLTVPEPDTFPDEPITAPEPATLPDERRRAA